jgi:peptidoglycan/xylan/chitin deacetylase (PgdA/CDA1 family)
MDKVTLKKSAVFPVERSGEVLKKAKILSLEFAKSAGVFDLLARSGWRRDRLLILAYHGVSQCDEHLWNPALYMTPEQFRDRMRLLKERGCNVLALGPALKMLKAGELPEMSVVITFDDGFHSFYRQAFPIIREFNWPVTIYLTSYYSGFNRPVFDVMCSYLLWKGRGQVVDGGLINEVSLDLRSVNGRSAAALAIRSFARQSKLSAAGKDSLLTSLAGQLGVDYETILANRLLHLLNPDEVSQLAGQGVDIQLHTHRHCAPNDRRLFLREVEENRSFIKSLTHSSASHFCYPAGVYNPQHFSLLGEANVVSATTCKAGLATNYTNPLALPRLTDTSSLHEVEFEGWLCGLSGFLPRRSMQDDEVINPFYY